MVRLRNSDEWRVNVRDLSVSLGESGLSRSFAVSEYSSLWSL
jgi:hypothetical protein